jgi:hypothetical protein
MSSNRGIYTTEFWVTAVVNIVAAVVAVLAAKGLVDEAEVSLWVTLAQAVAVAVAPIVMAIVTASYTRARAAIKTEEIRAESIIAVQEAAAETAQARRLPPADG